MPTRFNSQTDASLPPIGWKYKNMLKTIAKEDKRSIRPTLEILIEQVYKERTHVKMEE